VRLKAHLTDRGITPELERDFVDVQWKQDGRNVIGEVKLTAYLSRDEAFRTALGQLLVCAFCQLLQSLALDRVCGDSTAASI
jgi:hypothetical protein